VKVATSDIAASINALTLGLLSGITCGTNDAAFIANETTSATQSGAGTVSIDGRVKTLAHLIHAHSRDRLADVA
jgi:uncharacterized RmlC-like cupin family protein